MYRERHFERTREETAHKVAQLSQHVSDLMIQDMPALDVSELVADDEEQLVWRQVVDATGVEDEDWSLDGADAPSGQESPGPESRPRRWDGGTSGTPGTRCHDFSV